MSLQQQRQELRASLLAQRALLSKDKLLSAEAALPEQFNQYFEDSFGGSPTFTGLKVAGYLATRGEISPAHCLSEVRQSGGTSFLPVIRGEQLLFAPYDDQTPMQKAKFNIEIPVCEDHDLITPSELDIVLVPLVGFDASGGRLGMGGGFYDRSFAFLKDANHVKAGTTVFLGVAHEFQNVEQVPVESWDVTLDGTITETSVYRT